LNNTAALLENFGFWNNSLEFWQKQQAVNAACEKE
jgi:hypothetical protein